MPPNLLLDQAPPEAPDQVWVSDITYLALVDGGWCYLASWMDLFTRRIVGWQVDDNMEDALVIVPLRNALRTRQPPAGLIVHSDRGGQYVSNDLHELVRLWKLRPSMSRADDPYDNAFAESFWMGPPMRPFESRNAGRWVVPGLTRCQNGDI